MRIRRKLPKPSGSGQPLYIVGYASPAPALSELQAWFDLQYGGPLKLKESEEKRRQADNGSALVVATHGPWTSLFRLSCPSSETEAWEQQLDWSHPRAGAILRPAASPGNACDAVLHAARLARGLTLLTQGTAHDVVSHTYLNPSDWTDRPLDRFRSSDHVAVVQTDSPDPRSDWFHTLGFSKFGLDELETFQPVGLPGGLALETLAGIADGILRIGRLPQVGATLPLPMRGLSVTVLRHRTAAPAGTSLAFREVAWRSLE